MLDCIDRQQRNKLKLDNLSLPSPERHRPLRHQFSSDNMHVPPFNIPNLRIDQRKTSSAEDMARKNSTGSIRKREIFLHRSAVIQFQFRSARP
jgi:SCY1-like protein 2